MIGFPTRTINWLGQHKVHKQDVKVHNPHDNPGITDNTGIETCGGIVSGSLLNWAKIMK